MFIKWLLFLFILGFIDAQNDYLRRSSRSCMMPRIANGKLRVRPRSKIVKYICNYRYELVGNRYATCKNGQWDEPPPVCVRPGCPILPKVTNGVRMFTHNGAWMVVFCLPGHKLVGAPVMYCDGNMWNGTLPSCIDSKAAIKYSCDFEEDLCGWTQDEFHDFDWRRINRKTPSHYLLTGPSYDHTYGAGGLGYYMYIESTTRSENETARLLSPIYSPSVATDGCFSFFYHMFGKDIGGLRVYQKPDFIQLSAMLRLNDSDREAYMLFEQWGNLGDVWYSAVVDLKPQSDSFQIVIEGISGKSYRSDIAIDDVAILHGENCTEAKRIATIPPTDIQVSCNGRCNSQVESTAGCSCSINCLPQNNCCFDYIELCFFGSINGSKIDDDDSSDSTTVEQPQTEKLVASTLSTSTTTIKPKPTVPTTTTTTTTTSSTSTTTTTTPSPTTTPKPTTVTPKTTRRPVTIRTLPTKPTTRIFKPTTKPTSATKPIPPTMSTAVTKPTSTTKNTPPTKPTTVSTTTKQATTIRTSTTMRSTVRSTTTGQITYHDMIDDRVVKDAQKDAKKGSSGALKTAITTIVVLACLCAIIMGTVCARSSRGQQTIARLRGTTRRDPEVRYLSADVDD